MTQSYGTEWYGTNYKSIVIIVLTNLNIVKKVSFIPLSYFPKKQKTGQQMKVDRFFYAYKFLINFRHSAVAVSGLAGPGLAYRPACPALEEAEEPSQHF